MNPLGKRHQSIKEHSLIFLGHRYSDQPLNPIKEKILTDFSIDLVDIIRAGATDKAVCSINAEKANRKLKKAIKGELQLTLPVLSALGINAGGSGNVEAASSTTDESNKTVYGFAHIDYAECRINHYPSLKPDLNLEKIKINDNVIISGWVYTGYKILFEITTKIKDEGQLANVDSGAKVGWKGITPQGSATYLKDKLENKTITKITMNCDAYGNYKIPTFKLPKDLDGINQVIRTIGQDYTKNLHRISIGAFLVNRKCTVPITSFISQKLDDDVSNIEKVPPFCNIQQSKSGFDINTLRNHMIETTPLIERNLGFQLGPMLRAIDVTFTKIFEIGGKNIEPIKEGSYTIFMGYTGVGKSTLISYLLGSQLQRLPAKGGYCPVDHKSAQESYPTIGHGGSETRGFGVYGNYIDTAGIYDNRGDEQNICNAAAIHLAIKQFAPKNLVIVYDSSIVESRGRSARDLFQFVKKIMGILGDTTSKKMIRSLLFVINEKIPRTGTLGEEEERKKDFIDGVKDCIKVEKEEIMNKVGQENASWGTWLQSFVSKKRKTKEILSDLDKREGSSEKVKKLLEKYNQIEFLEKLLQEGDNIIVANILSNETKHTIDNWQRRRNYCDKILSLTTENLVEGGYFKFRLTMLEIIKYFNIIFTQREQLVASIETARRECLRIENRKAAYVRSKEKTIKNQELLEVIDKAKQKITAFDLLIKEKEELTTALKNSNELISLTTLDKKVKKANIFQFGKLTPIYQFHHSGITPIELVEKYQPKCKEGKNLGTYLDENVQELDTGKYTVSYKPKWWGYKEDENAKVTLFVKTCNDPATHTKIHQIQEEIKGLKIKKEEFKDKQTQANELLDKLQDFKSMEEIYDAQITKQKNTEKTTNEKLVQIDTLFSEYKKFCILIMNIVRGLQLDHSSNDLEREQLIMFCNNFRVWK